MLRPNEVLITDQNFMEHIDVTVDGDTKARGLIPRDYTKYPQGYLSCAPAFSLDIPLIPQAEWSERIKDKIAQQSQNSDIRLAGNNGQPIPSLDQNGKGYCWAHSTTQA